MDRAMMTLSLEEEEVPFKMSDLPGVSSAEENELSLMGGERSTLSVNP